MQNSFVLALELNRLVGKNTGLNLGRLFFGQVHDGLGGNIRHLISGGAALPRDTNPAGASPLGQVIADAQLGASRDAGAQGAYDVGDLATGTITPHFESSLEIYDSLGAARTVAFGFSGTSRLPSRVSPLQIVNSPRVRLS